MRIPFRASDGVLLHLHRVGACARSSATPLLMVPGMFSDHTFFMGTRSVGMAHALAQERVVYVLDRRRTGHWNDWVERDVPEALQHVLVDSGRPRVHLLGHSAGAGAALCTMLGRPDLHDHVGGLALLSVPHPKTRGLRRTAGLLFAMALTRALGRFPSRALRMSRIDETRDIFNPWLRWHWDGEFGPFLREKLPSSMPVYSATGESDTLWAPPRGVQRLHEQVARAKLSTFVTFPGGHVSFAAR